MKHRTWVNLISTIVVWAAVLIQTLFWMSLSYDRGYKAASKEWDAAVTKWAKQHYREYDHAFKRPDWRIQERGDSWEK